MLLPMASKKQWIRFIGLGLTICLWLGTIITTAAIIKANPGAEYEEYFKKFSNSLNNLILILTNNK